MTTRIVTTGQRSTSNGIRKQPTQRFTPTRYAICADDAAVVAAFCRRFRRTVPRSADSTRHAVGNVVSRFCIRGTDNLASMCSRKMKTELVTFVRPIFTLATSASAI